MGEGDPKKDAQMDAMWDAHERAELKKAGRGGQQHNLRSRRARNLAALTKLETEGEGALSWDEKRWAAKAARELKRGKNAPKKAE